MDYIASKIAPHHKNTKYWVDLSENPYGGIIKFWNGNTWDYVNNADDQDRDITEIQNYIKNLSGTVIDDNYVKQCTQSNDSISLHITKDTNTIQSNGNVIKSKGVDQTIVTIPSATSEKAGVMAASDKNKLNNIEAQANRYVLPTATASSLGGIKIGFTNIPDQKKYGLLLDENGKAYVMIPVDSIINNTLTSDSTTVALSAAQGKILKSMYDELTTKYAELEARVESLENPAK